MATGSKNAKSQSLTARIPHDVIEGMESVKLDGESNAGFIVTAMRGEIARRQAKEAEKIPGFFARCAGAGGKNRSQSCRGDRAARHRRT